ncbi:MAG: DALR domain-containing protein, partial [Ginsengibacter sp.]
DFSSEALAASEKGLKRLWEAYGNLKSFRLDGEWPAQDDGADIKINKFIDEFKDFMNDDFNTAKVLANMFEIVPVINSIRDGLIGIKSLSSATLRRMKHSFTTYLEDVFGLKDYSENNETLSGVMNLIIEIRKDAKSKKDFATSDKIRKQLTGLGINMKDEKDGSISWAIK